MFELSFVKKYLIPRKRQLSVSLIALMSVGVISVVVWLTLIFLSVTEGIEKNWLHKLTSLNAPIRITPTPAYFSSYYYQIDALASDSDFTYKNIREKLLSDKADPYMDQLDSEIPSFWPTPDRGPDGRVIDLVKTAFNEIEACDSTLIAEDYEMSAGLLRLKMVRPQNNTPMEERQSYLTQVAYIASFSEKSPDLRSLIYAPTPSEIDHLFRMAEISPDPTHDEATASKNASQSVFQQQLARLTAHTTISKVKTSQDLFRLPTTLLSDGGKFSATAIRRNNTIAHLFLTEKDPGGTLEVKGNDLFFEGEKLARTTPIFINEPLEFEATLHQNDQAMRLSDLKFAVSATLQGQPLRGELVWQEIEISEATAVTHFNEEPTLAPLWAYEVNGRSVLPMGMTDSVMLPKNYRDSGVRLGDTGYLSYGAMTAGSVQEMRLPIRVAGFYDTGVMAIGAKMILTDPDLVHQLSLSNQSYTFDRSEANGIHLWTNDLKDAKSVKKALTARFEEAGIAPYFTITTFHDYDFARDLLQQFQSDKVLFTLIGVIILLVACTNIISLLVLLVSDKKREIGIMSAMGASTKSIAWIFSLSGALLGIIGCAIGILLALVTLQNIDHVARFLSFFQGHDAFNAAFYGNSLPSELSKNALLFIAIATPLLSLVAGLVPAIKASRLRPSEILRSGA